MVQYQAYVSPKITDISGRSMFCGDADEWVIHWNNCTFKQWQLVCFIKAEIRLLAGVVSWWDRRRGTLVRGPIEFHGLKCLSAPAHFSQGSREVRLAVGRRNGRIELWSGQMAAAVKGRIHDPTHQLDEVAEAPEEAPR